ncbi:MAG: hypothetical protein A2068_11595 [Ignavibacteria bacterium GWB2_35_6b]|nr:MAG: hypothetical protein A2068_11595 [Ignavibacteria bacterium GWB2_35_6b]
MESVLIGKLNNLPHNADLDLFLEFRVDLTTQSNTILDILKTKLPNDNRKNISFIKLIEITPHRFQVESNITSLYHELSHKKVYEIIGQSIMAISGLNLRLYKMKHYESLVGFINGDIPIFKGKMDFLNKKLAPTDYQENFYRILELANLPNINYAIKKNNVDINKFLEIRKSDEIQEFRNWIWNLDSYSDPEIIDRINSFKNKLGNFYHSKTGKTLRWLVSSGIGSIPGINFVAGPIISKIDEYVGDKLLKKKGAIAFINNIYPSVFKNMGI